MSTQQFKTVNTKNEPVRNHCTQCMASDMLRLLYADLERDGYRINRDAQGIVRTVTKGGHTVPVF